MRSSSLFLYHSLPASLRPVVATLRGLYLRSWRYGPETDKLARETLERDHWTPQQWHDWQQQRLDYVLRRASTLVPFYREQWNQPRSNGTADSRQRLDEWPILEKQSVRANPGAFLADGCHPWRMFHDHTSGTTGTSLDIWQSRETVRTWYALYEARCRLWYGVSRHDHWGILGGQLVVPVNRRRPPFWMWNASLKQLYLSCYHLAPDLIPHYLRALHTHRVTYLLGYTSALYALARQILETKQAAPPLKVIITNAEPVFSYQRQAIAEAFQCPVRETYAMSETVASASECEAGRLHLWPEAGFLEILDGDKPVRNGEVGDLVCTGLINADMPLVRYRVGDRASLPSVAESCPCGRTLPVLGLVEGRSDDLLYTSDGRRIGRMDPVFKSNLPVREAQIVQHRLDLVRVRFVPATGFTDADGRSIISNVQARMGAVNVILEPLPEIPRSANGKFRAVICDLSPADKELANQAGRPDRLTTR